MEPRIGIKPENSTEVAHALIQLLADEFILYVQTKKAHWNVTGPNFLYLHTFFEKQYTDIDEIGDDIAERIRAIGHFAPATLREYQQLTHLTERTNQPGSAQGYLTDLLKAHESIIVNLRKHINSFNQQWHDAGSSDFVTGIMFRHEKMAWMLRSHLE